MGHSEGSHPGRKGEFQALRPALASQGDPVMCGSPHPLGIPPIGRITGFTVLSDRKVTSHRWLFKRMLDEIK